MANVASPVRSGAAKRRLCVVSRNPVMSGVFAAGLTTAVGSRDELEIIVDRRHGSSTTSQPSIERRQRDHVVRALERDGFAFVLMPTAEAADATSSRGNGWPVERFVPEESYEHKLERLLWFKQGRLVRLSRLLILSVLMNAILLVFFVSPALKARWSAARATGPATSITAPAPPGGVER